MPAVVGVDIGTTSAKAAAFDPDGTMHGRDEAAYELHEPEPGHVEQDPREVAAAGVRLIECAEGPVALSSAMHSLVGVDGGGEPVTPLITWGDTRAVDVARRLRAEHGDLHPRTGTPLHPMSPLCKLVWLRENDPGTFRRAERWCGIKELVVHRVTGEWVMDHSVASGSGLMNLAQLDWDAEALEVAGLSPDQLPRLVATTEQVGGLVVGAGDGPLANLGLGAVAPGVGAISIGTSGALRVIVEDPAVDRRRRTFCYALTPGRWAVGGAINNGGVVLEWLTATLGADVDTLLAEAAEVEPGSDGLIMLPYLLSERAPRWTGTDRGGWIGLNHRHTRGHLVRSALEGVCRQLALVLASLADAGYEVRELRATGGFARSALWRQLLADVLGMPVGFTEGHEGSAFGAALLGMEALGEIDSIERAAALIEVSDVVDPDPGAAAAYAQLLPEAEAIADALD